jgi:hypothetical protein
MEKRAAMRKPTSRDLLPTRHSDNDKRRLHPAPDATLIARLATAARYSGSNKHKADPAPWGLPPFVGKRGDETLCDRHAGFAPRQDHSIPRLLRRGIHAGLIGDTQRLLWTIGDDGWIFEGRITNAEQHEYHGYPVRPNEAIAEAVYRRFACWASTQGSHEDRNAAARCRAMYGFAP